MGHHMISSSASRRVLRGGWVLGVLFVGGCEKFPWSLSGAAHHEETKTSALTTAQSAVTPERPAVLPDGVRATVNKVPISKADLELSIQEFKAAVESSGQAWKPLAADKVQKVMDDLVNTELMSQDAVSRGLTRSLGVQQRWEHLRRGFFAQEWYRAAQQRLEVNPADIAQYYGQNKEGFREREQVKLRQLTVNSEEQAKQALAQLYGGTVTFDALAQQVSVGPTAGQGGLLPRSVMRAADKAIAMYMKPDLDVIVLDPVLEKAAFAIDRINGLSPYVKGPDSRFHIFQLVERQEERPLPLAEVSDQIKRGLLIQKLQGAVDELKGKAVIESHADRLEGISQ